MFLILSQPRSGSTLLVECLNAHPDILVPDETDFIVPLNWVVDTVPNAEIGRRLAADITVNSVRFPHSIGEWLTADEVRHALEGAAYDAASMVKAIYAAIGANSGHRVTGDKSPNYVGHLGILLKTGFFRDIKIIHLIRDPRDVTASIHRLGWSDPQRVDMTPRSWNNSNVAVHRNFANQPNYFMLRYEDLVADPSRQLQQIAAFLNVPFREEMLDHTRRRAKLRQQPHHTNVFSPISTNWIGGWRNVAEVDFTVCTTIAAEGMHLFGYS